MGTLYWLGTATAVAQVTTIQVTSYAVGTTYKITVGGVVISTIAQGGVNATATALAAAWEASTHPYCVAVAAVASTDTVTLTANTAGVPFVVTSSVSGSTGTIGAASTGTANAGPNDYSTVANWSTGAIPINSDVVIFRDNAVPCLWGLAQSGITPASLIIEQSYTGRIGLPYNKFTTAGGATKDSITYEPTVAEYRQSYLATGAAILRIGETAVSGASAASIQGSSLIKVDLGSTNAAASVFGSGRADTGDSLPPVRLKMNHASATLNIYGSAQVLLCGETPTETGQIATGSGYDNSQTIIGSGVTQATHNQIGGRVILNNVPTTLVLEASGKAHLAGTGTITTFRKRGEHTVSGTIAVTTMTG